MKKKTVKPGRGGPRPGAGRPEGATGPYIKDRRFVRGRVGIRLPRWMISFLKSHPKLPGRLIEHALIMTYTDCKRPKRNEKS